MDARVSTISGVHFAEPNHQMESSRLSISGQNTPSTKARIDCSQSMVFAVESMPRWLSSRGLNVYCSSGLFRIELPYRFLLPFAAVVTVLPWTRQLRFRFSLRTLL